jgi:hypothetical protein
VRAGQVGVQYFYPVPAAQGQQLQPNINKPFMLEVRDTMFVLTLEGLKYFNDRIPRGSQANPAMEDPR